MKLSELAVAALLLTASSTAYAHIRVESHKTRHTSSDQKNGPCGRANSKRNTANVETFKSGETITLKVNEYIPHPGWFRVSFDQDGDDDFVAPKSIDPPSFDDNDAVLMDKLDMHQTGLGGTRTWQVKLPDVECDNCTLQVIQVMLDKPPYDPQDNGALSNDIYYACIDMVLKREGGGASTPGDAGAQVGNTTASQDAGASAARDAGTTAKPEPEPEEEAEPKPPEAAANPRDAGRSTGNSGSASTSPTKDAGTSHADHDDEEADHDEEDAEDDESDDSKSATPSGDEGGCALGAANARNAWPVGLLLVTLVVSRLRRRRRSS